MGRGPGSPLNLEARESASPRPVFSAPADNDKASEWVRTIAILQKNWKFSAGFAGMVMATVICVTLLTKPVYEATATIEVDPPGEVFSLEGGGSVPSDAEYLETQAKVLHSESLAVSVIRKLRLDQNPEIVKPEAVDKNTLADNAPYAAGLPLTPSENAALVSFNNLLKVKRDTSSRLILVSFENRDPQLAARISNSMAQTFIDEGYQTRHDAIMKSSEWLSRQLDDLRAKMEDSTHALSEFQQTIGVADMEGDKSSFTEHIGELSRQLTLAEAERIQLQALLKNVQGSNPDSLPEVRNNPVVQQLSQRLAERRVELSQALVVYGKNHPNAKKLQTEVEELQAQIESQKKAILTSTQASFVAANARENLMAAEIKGTTKEINQVARYNSLKKEVQANVDLYNSLYAKIKEAGIAAASKSANVRIVDPARAPEDPIRPRRILNLAVGLFAALIGGVVLAFAREEFDNKVRSPEDVRKWLGRSSVSIIPVIAESDREPRISGAKTPGLVAANGGENSRTNRFLLDRPHSPEAEALQALCASIMLSSPTHPPQVLLMVSAFPGEGKTTLAMNLAFALAKHGSTCLVDADLRKGRIGRVFELEQSKGLSDLLTEAVTLDEVLVDAPGMNNLSVIPAGKATGNAPQLTCSEGMQEVLQVLRQRYRFVVVDSSPILPFVDGRALSTLADAVVLVGRAGMTTRQAMRRCVELISEVNGAPIMQVVLNAAQLDSADYKYYGYGYDYQNQAAQ